MKKITHALILLAFFAFCNPSQAQVVVNEVVSSNATLNVDEDGEYQDWVELYNNGPSSVNLNGFGLTDTPAQPLKWMFPNVTIASGQYLLIYCSDKNRVIPGQPLHTNWKISGSGENIVLSDASGVLVDQAPAAAIEEDFSYGRFPNGTGPFAYFDDVTPGAQNAATGYNEILNAPTFSQPGGFFTTEFDLTLSSSDAGVTILYTLDGSDPDPANVGGHTYEYRNSYNQTGSQTPGPLLTQSYETLTYLNPISIVNRTSEPNKISMISSTYHHDPSVYMPNGTIFKGTVVRVKVIKPGALPSPTVSQTYFVTPEGASRFELPVISISLNESDFYDYEDGIYVAGKDFDDWRAENPTANPQPERVGNYHRRGEEFEKRGNMTYFVGGQEVINQDVGLRIRGASTRRYESKSLTVYARSDYGDADLDYKFFSDLDDDSFERLTLSNSGSDFRNTMYRDALCHEVCDEQHVENENYQPTITFVNGEYWGILNIRERFDNNYFKRVYGFDDVDLLENDGDVEEGDDNHYEAVSTYLQNNDLSVQANYDYAVTQIDPESLADYYIANIFFDNSDWPGNNTQYWRKRTASYEPNAEYGADGRWRWVFHDMDDTFGVGTDQYDRNSLDIATTFSNSWVNPEWSTLWLRKMLQNHSFKNYFINRFADMMNSYYLSDVVIAKMNALANVITPELPEHRLRWRGHGNMSDFQWYMNWQAGFANARPALQRDHIREKFEIANNIDANLDVSDVDHGFIKINTLEITPALAGVNANPFPWTGIYFSNVPVTLKAIAKPGYLFSHWEGVSSATTAEITVNSATSFTAKAIFVPEGFAVEESEPVYFWMMNSAIPNDTPLTSLNSSYEILANTTISYSSSLEGYPFVNGDPLWRTGSMERRNQPTPLNYRPDANGGAPYAPGQMRGLQITQPFQQNGLENTMVFNLPTTGYKNIKFSFAAMDEGAATGITIDYAIDGTSFTTTGITSALALTTGAYQLFETDFTAITSANDNANFKVRVRFTGPNMTASDGNRVTFNNIAMDGVKMPLTYPNPNVFTVGTEISPLVPTTTATATSFSISGTLPDGLSFDTTTGIISGTPSIISPMTTYIVTATNPGGSTSYDVIIIVNEVAPSALSYTTPNVFTVNSAIVDLAPMVTGNVTSYAISPALPAGLSFDTTTGIISGTPTAVSANATYTITATNSGGNTTFDIEIAVNEIAPLALSYTTPNVFTVNSAIVDLTPTVTGNVTSYAISPALPIGLSFDTTIGIISGTPTAVSANATYTITATNSGGNTTFDIEIAVNEIAPTALSYTTPNVFTVNSAIVDLTPTVTGNVTSYAISPALPIGLSFDTTTGIISGTPTAVSANATYTITATNSGGNTTFDIEIAVNEIAPTALSYTTPNVFTVNSAIVDLTPTVTGNVTSYAMSPALPVGLSFDTTTGIISGTPTAVSANATYTITATNPGGNTTFDIEIAVNEVAPSALSYTTPNVFTVNSAIVDLTPTVTGNVTSYAISPALPAGLSFDTTTGIISGTPTAVSSIATYTVTATNNGGSTTFDLEITVNPAAPSALSYATPNTFIVGTAITALTPTVTGNVTSYAISPALPAGLSFNTTTGVISGTPTSATTQATYTVTASNVGGSTTFGVVITVNMPAPGALSYTTPNVFTVGTTISPLFAGINGFVIGFSVSPALPAGLTLDPVFGFISGTPTAVTGTATYTVSAFNLSGTVSFGVVITVNDVAPASLTYPTPNIFTVGTATANLSPSVTGNVVSYSVSPTLPAGLSFDTSTGIISGTPNNVTATATYTVTATNSGGSTTFGVVITVNDAAPSALSYDTPNVFTVGTAITSLTPTVTGDVTSYAISPSLPAGLSFDIETGIISGTPTSASAQTSYTVTATNSGGNATFDVVITVNEAAPSELSYNTPNVFTVGTAIVTLSPTVTGSVTSYSVSPSLPVGLSFDATSGEISGTPTTATAIATYTVTAQNVSGNATFGVVITVNVEAPASLSYTSPNIYTVGTAITSLLPTIVGSADAFTVSPALPDGLSLDATSGIISGTPTEAMATATYTVTATNVSGSTSFGVIITVNDQAPASLSYTTPNVFTIGSAIIALNPTVTGSVSSYSISPVLPAGLTFDTTSGEISGTPTAVTATATYTVTAVNSGGSTTFGVVITVNDAAPLALSYPTPNLFTVGNAITDLNPIVTGNVVSYSISPALPAGLSFNTSTGVISGTPTVQSAATTYTVTATNSGGSATFELTITVNNAAPSALSYTTPNVFTVGSEIIDLVPNITGSVTSYSISPALPAGLSFDTTTGIISGTPTAVTATATYTVTATNSGGSVTFGVVITVNAAAPSALSYTTPNVFTVGNEIIDLVPNITGSVTSYSISPALPAGLSFDTTTGIISGTPTAVTATATYTVTATNSGGSVTFGVVITVNAAAPSALSYTTPNVFTVGNEITDLVPNITGSVTSYSISPALPAGLSFDTTTGIISGTPTAVTATATYTVTATNSGGSVTFGVVITVNAAAPVGLSYPTPLVFTENTSITDVVPTITGTDMTFTISPSLPAGLSFDPATGVISGTPTEESPETIYTVTATNSGGSVTFEVTITVDPELGIGDQDQLVFSVYPNPFEDHVMISGISGRATYSLIAIDGKVLQKGNVEGNTIRFGGLPQGVFVLSVVSEDGKSGMRKIVRK